MAFKLTNKPSKFRALGTFLDADTIAYAARIATAGGSISHSSLVAVDRFVSGCKQDGIWNLLLDVGVFAGNDLNAALVKLKYPGGASSTFTNFNFASGDYSETTGLVGNGSTKYLNTGFVPATHLASSLNTHISVGLRNATIPTGTSNPAILGALSNSDANRILIRNVSSGNFQAIVGLSSEYALNAPSYAAGFYAISNTAANTGVMYRGGILIATEFIFSTNALPTTNLSLFARTDSNNAIFEYSNSQIYFYSIGTGLTSTQAANLNSRVQSLQQALNRAV